MISAFALKPGTMQAEQGSRNVMPTRAMSPRLQEMRSAESRQEIIECRNVRRYQNLQPCGVTNLPFGMEEIICTDA